MENFTRRGDGLCFTGYGETLLITPWGRDALRVRSAMCADVQDTRYALLDPAPATPEISLGETEARITCGKLTCVAKMGGRAPSLRFENERGETLLSEYVAPTAQQRPARCFSPAACGGHRLVFTFAGDEREHIYGMGQYQTEHVDLQGCTLELLQRNTQSSVPFYISSKGYGFLWHNPAVGQVTFGANEIRWEAESALQADYLIVCGDTPAEISARYGEAVGTAPEMPEHGLGFWQCKLRYWNQEQLLSVAREYRRRGLPLDCIVCDFFHWTALGDFRFDPEFFPDPAAMVRELNEMGVRLVVSVWPAIGPSSENYREMARRNLLVRTESADQVCMTFGGENSMFYDVTNPEARDFVWDKIRRNYVDNGIRDFWLDVAEPEYSTYELRHFRYRMGPALQVGNLYPQLYAKNFYDGLRSAGVEKPVSLIRCAWAGSARYGALAWSGDVGSTWQNFRIQLCAGLSMGAAGIPWWNSDIGGFFGGRVDDPAFTELLIRWFEWGAYCPVMRLHGNREPGSAVTRADGKTCMMTGADNEVWSYGDEAYEIFKKYILRREALRPYIRTLMHAAHTDGTPVMRAMWYAFPQDPACAQLKDQYMFGDRYLVCPVMTPGARSREAYLPAGRWRCADTGAEYDGGRTVTLPAPLDCIPVLERV